MWISVVVLLVCLAALWLVTDWMVAALSSLAQQFKIPQSVAGATLAAMGSSLPEFGTNAFAVTRVALAEPGTDVGYADVGFGTIVGSALFNLCMIIGIPALIRDLDVSRRVLTRDAFFYLIACIQTVVFIWDGQIVAYEAAVWVVTYVIYFAVLMRDIKKHPEAVEEVESIPAGKAIAMFMGSLAVIAVACHFLVEHTVHIATAMKIPTVLISLVVLAFGTSIPDLLASIQATRQGNTSLAVSNAIGSNCFDILVCLGAPVLFFNSVKGAAFEIGAIPPGLDVPEAFSQGVLLLSVLFLSLTMLACLVVLRRGWKVVKWEGWVLIALYVAFVASLSVLWVNRSAPWLEQLLTSAIGSGK